MSDSEIQDARRALEENPGDAVAKNRLLSLLRRNGARPIVTASFVFSGNSQYWGGNGERWKDNKGCLFAHVSPGTTLKQLVDGWVEDSLNGDLDDKEPWEGVTSEEIRDALVEMLTPDARKEYADKSAGPCEIAREIDVDFCVDCDGAYPQLLSCQRCNGSGHEELNEDFDCQAIVLVSVDMPEDE